MRLKPIALPAPPPSQAGHPSRQQQQQQERQNGTETGQKGGQKRRRSLEHNTLELGAGGPENQGLPSPLAETATQSAWHEAKRVLLLNSIMPPLVQAANRHLERRTLSSAGSSANQTANIWTGGGWSRAAANHSSKWTIVEQKLDKWNKKQLAEETSAPQEQRLQRHQAQQEVSVKLCSIFPTVLPYSFPPLAFYLATYSTFAPILPQARTDQRPALVCLLRATSVLALLRSERRRPK